MKASDIYNGHFNGNSLNSFTLGMLMMNLKQCPVTKNFYVYVSYRRQKAILKRKVKRNEKRQFLRDLRIKTNLPFIERSNLKKKLPLGRVSPNQFICCILNDMKISEKDLQEALISNIEKSSGIIKHDFLSGSFSLRGTLDKKRGNTTNFQQKGKVLCDFFYCTKNHKKRKHDIMFKMTGGASNTINVNDGANRLPRKAQFRMEAKLFKRHSKLIFQYKQDCLDEVCK